MTIEQLAKRIIREIKAWPEEARQSQDGGSPRTSWDEYKEQIQYEEYDSFEVFEETIESMVMDEVSELSEKVVEKLYRSIYKSYYPATFEEKRTDITNKILYHIKSEAESQDIEYDKPALEFIRYYVADLVIVAEVLSKVGPEEFLICGYSEATGTGGEQGVANLSVLDDENGLERITQEEFEKVKNCMKDVIESSEEQYFDFQTEITNQNNDRQRKPEGKTEVIHKAPLPVAEEAPQASTGRDEGGAERAGSQQSQSEIVTPKDDIDKVNDLFDGNPINTPHPATKSGWGESDTVFTEAAYEEAKRRLREHFENNNSDPNNKVVEAKVSFVEYYEARSDLLYELSKQKSGFNPKLGLAGITISNYHFENGARSFTDFAKAMVLDVGHTVIPYIKSFYILIRNCPDDKEGEMDDYQTISKVDIEKIIEEI